MAAAPPPFENVLIVSDSILCNNTDKTWATDNTWIRIPGVKFDVVRGRTFVGHSWTSKADDESIWQSPTAVRKVVIVTSGNDLRSKRGSKTRRELAADVGKGIKKAISGWQEKGVSVCFVFIGSWALHASGFNDHQSNSAAQENYENCKTSMLLHVRNLNIQILDEDTNLWTGAGFPKKDGWHFEDGAAPAIVIALQRILTYVVPFMTAPQPPREQPREQPREPTPQRKRLQQWGLVAAPQAAAAETSSAEPQAAAAEISSVARTRLQRWGRGAALQAAAAAAETSSAEPQAAAAAHSSRGSQPLLQDHEEMRTWPDGRGKQYPYCTMCDKWSDEKHRASAGHHKRSSDTSFDLVSV